MIIDLKENYEIGMLEKFSLLKKKYFIKLLSLKYNDEQIEELVSLYLKNNIISEFIIKDKDEVEERYFCIKNFETSTNPNLIKASMVGDSFLVLLKHCRDSVVNNIESIMNRKDWIEYVIRTTTSNKDEMIFNLVGKKEDFNRKSRFRFSFIKDASGDIVFISDGRLVVTKDIYPNYTLNSFVNLINNLYHYYTYDDVILCFNDVENENDIKEMILEASKYMIDGKGEKSISLKDYFHNIKIYYVNENGSLINKPLINYVKPKKTKKTEPRKA